MRCEGQELLRHVCNECKAGLDAAHCNIAELCSIPIIPKIFCKWTTDVRLLTKDWRCHKLVLARLPD